MLPENGNRRPLLLVLDGVFQATRYLVDLESWCTPKDELVLVESGLGLSPSKAFLKDRGMNLQSIYTFYDRENKTIEHV